MEKVMVTMMVPVWGLERVWVKVIGKIKKLVLLIVNKALYKKDSVMRLLVSVREKMKL